MTLIPPSTTTISNDMNSFRTHVAKRSLQIVLFFALVLSVLIAEISAAPARDAADQNIKYAVIVDAGSSGSRIYVYKYDSSRAVPNLEQLNGKDGRPWAHKAEPGISTLAGKLGEVEKYIDRLIQPVRSELPESSFPRGTWSDTPFMWFATAGMRLLPAKEADDLTQKIREVAKNKNVVPFGFEDRWARTLSGEEEGAFAWISLNYLNGFFTTDGVEEYGVVETGGASSQMTFLAKGNILSNKFIVIIDRKVYPLYTHSFLYFGQDQILKRIFYNECFCHPSGKIESCTPCIDNNVYNGNPVLSACLIKDYTREWSITHEGTDYKVTLKGTGDSNQCAEEMDYLFRPDYKCFTKPCSFAGVYQPPFSGNKKFYGASVIRHITKDLGLTSEFTWKQLQAATDDFCKRDVGSLDPKERFQWLRCAAGNYIASLFKNLQFGPNHRINTPKRDTWTIGAVLYTLRIKIITSPISCYDGAGQRDLLENA